VAGIVAAEALLFAGFEPVRLFFTPIVWSLYILAADGAVEALAGRSQLSRDPWELVRCAVASIPIWLVFEAYNLRLENWVYVGLPEAAPLRLLGYGWSFATILPALFETSDLVLALARWPLAVERRAPQESGLASPGTRVALVLFGGLCLAIPLLAPRFVAASLFALVWVGFIFLLDPINATLGRWSPFTDWGRAVRGRFVALLAGGLACGLLWEFWNYWAGAKWLYVFPILQDWKLFAMPRPGFLGFPPFAVECFLMYDLVSRAYGGGWGRRFAPGAAASPQGPAASGR
jgi:hypothetical protein